MFRRAKRIALFLSIELVMVIIIVTAVIAAVVMGAGHLKDMYTSSGIIREVMAIGEGVNNFKQLYGYYPGDMPSSKISGELATGQIKSNTTSLETANISAWAAMASDRAVFADLEQMVRPRTGIITGAKSIIAAQQLTAASLIKPFFISSSIKFDTVTIGSITQDVMRSEIINNLNYVFYLDACDQKGYCDPGIFSHVYNPAYGVYPSVWSGTPRIAATSFGPSGADYPSSYNWTEGHTLYGITGGTYNLGSKVFIIPPHIAHMIDNRIDDGLPFGSNSSVVSVDVVVSNTYPILKLSKYTTFTNNMQYFVSGTDYSTSLTNYQQGCTTLMTSDFGTTSNILSTNGVTGSQVRAPTGNQIFKANFDNARYHSHRVTNTREKDPRNCAMLFAIKGVS